ncbi:MAG: ISAzo13 family transposase, partial [Desulfobacteraceae bacterium]|nr:ISAzo13 family transposase [Desulfobacteraceae bacterium]
MISSETENAIRVKYKALQSELDERGRRMWAAAEATSLGHGGVVAVARATDLAESTIRIGRREMKNDLVDKKEKDVRRVRKKGGGRKPLVKKDDKLLDLLDSLVEPTARGDPMSPLRWTCKSTRRLAGELSARGHPVSHAKVGQLLSELNYSLQSNRKRMEGKAHPDRNAQFNFINNKVMEFQLRGQPVISVDTKKKELIGRFSNVGREYQPKGNPEEVETYDFLSLADGKGIPYGVYDMTINQGWVCVGTDHDTAQFAVHAIRQWWRQMGLVEYSRAKELLITADGGGSNGSRNRLWKYELQKLADETLLAVAVCHFPPGTSKWNKIEHRMFSHITKNWRGRPLTSHEVIVNLIANTTTDTGLKIQAALDSREYPTGIKVSDQAMKELQIKKHKFHGEWNYT